MRFPSVPGLRPTPDRVRETLYNWLGQDLTGRATLDAFTGSGVLTLEALSRGARLAVAVDRNPAVVRALVKTATLFGAQGLEAHCEDALAFLSREARQYDVIFLDPPFHEPMDSRLLSLAIARLATGGAVYIEAPDPVDAPTGFTVSRRDKAGRVHYHLLRRIEDR